MSGGIRQNDLFSALPKRPTPNKAQLQAGIQNAVKKVADSKKYQPSIVLPQYSILRQKIILIENLVKQGRLTAKPNYHVIRDKDTLWEVVKNIKQVGMLPWDSEFDNLNYELAKLIGISLTDKATDQHYYIPFIHCDSRRNILPNQITYEEFAEVAGELFTDPKIKKITHQYNACDNQVLEYNTGLRVRGQYWDTLLFMNAIDENHKDNSLKKLYVEFVLQEDGKDETFDSLFEGISFAFVPIDVGYIYACYDAERTDAVFEWQRKYLSAPEYKNMLKHYIEVEAPQIEVVSSMQQRGVNINTDTARSLHDEYTELLISLKKEMDDFFGNRYGLHNINYGSPQQMASIIYDKLGCVPFTKGKDKVPDRGTGEEIIEKLVEKYPQFDILKKLLLYRGTAKLLNTYIDSIPAQLSPKDGKLRGRFHSHGARTGRYSSSEPNLQNIPSHKNKETGKDDSRIRNLFVPQKGYAWISSDYSQIEPRILAYRCDDYIMLNAYNTGKDLYSLMASQVYNVPYELCLEATGPEAKMRRDSMKSVLLGLMYGRQAASIGQQIGLNARQAQQFVDNFFQQYPNIKQYIDETVRLGTLLGYVTTIYDRRRRLPDLNHPNEFIRSEAQRQAVNATIQGSSADITKRAMRDIYYDEWLTKNDCHLVLTIHDEVVVEVPKDRIHEAGERVRQLMIGAADLLATKMPIKCDVEVFEEAWNYNGYKLKFS